MSLSPLINWWDAKWYAQVIALESCIWLSAHCFVLLIYDHIIRLFCGLGISKCLCGDTLSDTLSFSSSNIAFGCPFPSFIKINFVCFADWGRASDTLSDALSFPPWNIAFGCPFLSFTKITLVCLADWESASDTLSDALSSPHWNIAFVCPFLSFIR